MSYDSPAGFIGLDGDMAYLRHELDSVNRWRWQIVPGLCGTTGAVSIKSPEGTYLRHRDGKLYNDPFEECDGYKREACFIRHINMSFKGYDAFESVDSTGYYIYHSNNEVKLEKQQSSADFEEKASFRVIKHRPKCTMIHSYAHPDHFLAVLNNPNIVLKPQRGELWTPVKPGLTGVAGTVSFRMCRDARFYAHINEHYVASADSAYGADGVWLQDATFIPHKDKWFPGYDAYEAVRFPGHFLHNSGDSRKTIKIKAYDGSCQFEKDASFKFNE